MKKKKQIGFQHYLKWCEKKGLVPSRYDSLARYMTTYRAK